MSDTTTALTVYVLAEEDIVVPVALCTTLDQCDTGSGDRSCEVCQREVLGETFYPHTYCDNSGVALCLPCQMTQVAHSAGSVGIVDERLALTIIADSTGRHAA